MRLFLICVLGILQCFALAAVARADFCNVEVTHAIERFAKEATRAASGVGCETGTVADGNCMVAGVLVDASCNSDPSRLQTVLESIREVRGQAGMGCLNTMNGRMARALLSLFQRNPPYTICCGACVKQGLPNTQIDNGLCADTPVMPGQNVQNAVVLNMGPNGVFGKGDCGRGRYDHPVAANLFHEMLHSAGLAGVDNHSRGTVTDNESKIDGPDRNFMADPVYGCQTACFGRANLRTSTRCLACSTASPNLQPCAPGSPNCDLASGIFCRRGSSGCDDRTLGPQNASNNGALPLTERLHAAEAALFEPAGAGASATPACAAFAVVNGDPGRARYLLYRDGISHIIAHAESASKCVSSQNVTGVASMVPATLLATCGQKIREMREACRSIIANSQCKANVGGYNVQHFFGLCKSAVTSYNEKIGGYFQALARMPAKRAQVAAINCADYFDDGVQCPGGPRQLNGLAECQRAVRAAATGH